MKIIVVSSQYDAADTSAAWVANRIRSAVRARGVCRLAVSGGANTALMFDALAGTELPWNRVQLFQVDERVAPDDDPDRNATQLAHHLLRHVAIRRSDVHLMGVTAKSLQQAARRYAATLGNDPLDIVHLGIGEDGHTASWPPGNAIVDSASAVAICDEFNGRVRMTLTPRVVNAARARLIFVTGNEKASPVASWIVQRADLPIAHVHRTGTTLVLDAAAASQLAHG